MRSNWWIDECAWIKWDFNWLVSVFIEETKSSAKYRFHTDKLKNLNLLTNGPQFGFSIRFVNLSPQQAPFPARRLPSGLSCVWIDYTWTISVECERLRLSVHELNEISIDLRVFFIEMAKSKAKYPFHTDKHKNSNQLTSRKPYPTCHQSWWMRQSYYGL